MPADNVQNAEHARRPTTARFLPPSRAVGGMEAEAGAALVALGVENDGTPAAGPQRGLQLAYGFCNYSGFVVWRAPCFMLFASL